MAIEDGPVIAAMAADGLYVFGIIAGSTGNSYLFPKTLLVAKNFNETQLFNDLFNKYTYDFDEVHLDLIAYAFITNNQLNTRYECRMMAVNEHLQESMNDIDYISAGKLKTMNGFGDKS